MSTSKTIKSITILALLALLAAGVPAVEANTAQSITATITSPANGATFSRLDAIGFTATVSHTNCPPVATEWKFNDGTPVVTGTLSTTHQFAALGSYTVTFRAEPDKATCKKSASNGIVVNIVNLPPTALLAGSESAVAGDELVFDASGSSDAEGAIASYAWAVDGVAVAETGSALSTSFLAAGSHAVAVTVTDADGASASASLGVAVFPAALSTIAVSPASVTLTPTGSASFTAAGQDAYGNAVVLDATWAATCGDVVDGAYSAPTAAGACVVSAEQDGVVGTADISVVAGDLATITITGAESLVAGTSAWYALAGADAYGNAVSLALGSIEYVAPTTVGEYSVTYEEQGVYASLPVTVTPDVLATIVVSGPDAVLAGSTTEYDLAGADQYGNAVTLEQATLAFEAPKVPGAYTVSYEEAGVTGALDVSVLPVPLDVHVAAAQDLYSPVEALSGVVVTVAVGFPGQGGIEGAAVTLVVTHALLGNELQSETFVGVTGADGSVSFELPLSFGLAGDYALAASASGLGNVGEGDGAYAVGL